MYQKQCYTCNGLTGFKLVNGVCVETCGDGDNYNMECDDGNLNNGDGCSSTCTIE